MLTKNDLNRMSLAAFKPLFASLQAPNPPEMIGDYASSFIGPGWLRTIAGPGLALVGLANWRGKRFHGGTAGVNLVERKGEVVETMPVEIATRPSVIDQQPSLAVIYPDTTPFPWPMIVDELRVLEQGRFLGITYVNRGFMRGLVLPFLLEKD